MLRKLFAAEEVNNDHFEVERSADAKNWAMIQSIIGNGTSNRQNYYSAIDKQPLEGKSYYRLKQVDFDQRYIYSHMVVVNRKISEGSILYPNPVQNTLYVSSQQLPASASFYNILDIRGTSKISGVAFGQNGLAISVQSLVSGLYIIQIKSKDGEWVRLKFIKL